MKQELTKELLESLYVDQRLSIKSIHELTKNSSNCVRNKIKEFQLTKVLTKEDRIKQKGEVFITKEELITLYIENKMSIESIANKYSCSKNKIKNLLELYKIPIKTRAERFSIIHEKSKQTCLEKYGVEYPYQIPRVRDKMIRKVQEAYSTGTPQAKLRKLWGSPNTLSKSIQTKKLNGTMNTSQPEEQAYQMLLERFHKSDIVRQYSSDKYKWPCDFYIKSLDLYIEFQGSWCHGHCPFDPTSEVHQKLVQKWKEKDTEYFSYAVKIWTREDPLKRRVAKENNLNWKEFFSLEELSLFIQGM